jgi:hypothetical protein
MTRSPWLILTALAVVITVTRLIARRHPKVPPHYPAQRQ